MKCSMKTTNDRKNVEEKNRWNNKGNKQKIVTNMVDINPTISIIILNVNGPNTPTK